MRSRRISNVIGFDDAPFERGMGGKVALVGTVCSGTRLDIVVRGHVEQDGSDATGVMAELVKENELVHVRGVLMQGITVAGFNVVDINALAEELGVPVMVVMRKRPKMQKFLEALEQVKSAREKRSVLERAGPIEPCAGLWVHRAGLSLEEGRELIQRTTLHGAIPEPLRLAHIIAGGTTRGVSRGRA
ncbi:DUF99 family protein [Sorangium sp. So ce128]|uniref:endonuclease dU n=1 Tax=Sorangium sp. So ce128 TaxID=3133281 RepID=UPI003F5FDFA3